MKIHLVCVLENPYRAILELYHQSEPRVHDLVDDPEAADLILMVGSWDLNGKGIIESPLPRRYPEKTFAYYDSDAFIPLLPGIYTSPQKSLFSFFHRTESQTYVQLLNRSPVQASSEKNYLFSFTGGSTSLLRKRLYKARFNRPDILIEDTSAYSHWDAGQQGRQEAQERYVTVIARSHFVLCPRGAGTGSLRLFEVMQKSGCPVILADDYVLPVGPRWEDFAILVRERNYKKLPQILEPHMPESLERGRRAYEAYQAWFAPPVAFNRMVEACVRIRDSRRIPERWIQKLWIPMLLRARLTHKARDVARRAVLKSFRLLGLRFIFSLSRPE
jgi:hypothetical protein